MTLRYCKDCKFYVSYYNSDSIEYSRCNNLQVNESNSRFLVTGSKNAGKLCQDERYDPDNPCGTNAELFEKAPM